MHILHVVGARPNFMKAAPVMAALARRGARQTLVHTGQHYDAMMSDVFVQQLGMRKPDVSLAVGSAASREARQVLSGGARAGKVPPLVTVGTNVLVAGRPCVPSNRRHPGGAQRRPPGRLRG